MSKLILYKIDKNSLYFQRGVMAAVISKCGAKMKSKSVDQLEDQLEQTDKSNKESHPHLISSQK